MNLIFNILKTSINKVHSQNQMLKCAIVPDFGISFHVFLILASKL